MATNIWTDGTIYLGQDSLRIRLTLGTDVDITGAGTLEIRYKDPTGTTGAWTATSEQDDPGIIYYDFGIGSGITPAGEWQVQAYVVFSDGRAAYGEPLYFTVKTPPTG